MPEKAPLDLEEAFFETDHVRWRRLFPWLRLAEVIRLSLDPRKILLAMGGVIVYLALMSGLEKLPFFVSGESTAEIAAASIERQDWLESVEAVVPDGLDGASHDSKSAAQNPIQWIRSDLVVARPVIALLTAESIADIAEAITRLLVGLIIWAIFGGAIARVTALQFAGDHPTSTIESLRFACANVVASVVGPLLPLLGVLVFWLLIVIGGFISLIPAVGEPIAGISWGLTLLFSFFAVLLSFGAAISWPLMIVGTSVEATDSFDALSRGFSYVFSRPVYLILLVATAGLFGVVLTEIVYQAAIATELLAQQLFSTSGVPLWERAEISSVGHDGWWYWTRALRTAASAYALAYFWTAATVVYFLLRLSVDAMPLDRVYTPEDPDADGLAPLVGMPATERRERQREAEREAEANADATASSPSPETGE